VTGGGPTIRDERLGALLRELEVPEHRPKFYAELHYQLAEERRLRRVQDQRRAQTRRRRIRWTVRTAFAGAAAAIAALVLGVPWTHDGPEPATAAEVQAKVSAALSSAQSIGGELVVRGESYRNAYGWERRRWDFVLTAQGDFRFSHDDGSSIVAYDASNGIERSLGSVYGQRGGARERRGVAPGPPDHGPSESVLQRDFGALVRALIAAEDPAVIETTYEGRSAWKLVVAAEPNAIVPELSGDEFEVTVDKETGFPLRIVEKKNGAALDEIRIEDMQIDPKLTAADFTLRFPPGANVDRTDDGFRRVPIDQVEGIVGYTPLVPANVPEGYELTEVAVAEDVTYPTGAEAGNPSSLNVVSLAYRRGLDRFLVTTRLSHVPAPGEPQLSPQELWGDPLATGEGFRDEPDRIRLSGGALDGIEAKLLVVPRNTPHIWALTDKLVVTIAGDLSTAELVAVAESLIPR
jgi:outer membrane lipoprotein-sorting protein